MKVLLFLLVLCCAAPAVAMNPDEALPDPVLEARAREISKGLRCLVCQGEAIDESDAALARDLRLLVRERLQMGESDEAAVEYLRERYGDYISFRPPFRPRTVLLWCAPFAVMLAGLAMVWRLVKKTR